MRELEISRVFVEMALNKLKIDKSPGPDKIHHRILKELARSLSVPLSIMYRDSIDKGYVPDEWKKAQISVIYKKGSRSLASNYRPVSLTSIVCKTMERLIIDHIIEYMKENSLFSKKQFGFISGRSTSLQLLTVLDKWTESLDQGKSVDCIYMDYQKAFDTVPHGRLLSKLRSYKMSEPILRWISSFLQKRTQRVVINGHHSEWMEVPSGIPQGSVLGLLLFVIFINDLPDVASSDIYLFADDTKISRPITTEGDEQQLQSDLDNLTDWSDTWLLKFHPDKCKHMHIGGPGPTKDHSYTLHGKELH